MEFVPHLYHQEFSESNSESDDTEVKPFESLPHHSIKRQLDSHHASKSGSEYQPTSDAESSDLKSSASKGSVDDASTKENSTESDDDSIPPIRLNVKLLNNKLNKPSEKHFSNYAYHDGSYRQAKRNICYTIHSDSDEDEMTNINKAKIFGTRKDSKSSDSDFEISDAMEDDVMNFDSDSLVDENEISSDEYFPYSTSKVGKRRKRRKGYDDDFGWGRKRNRQDENYFSDNLSASDYNPGDISFGGRSRKEKNMKRNYDDYDNDFKGFTRTTGRVREYISYKESSSAEEIEDKKNAQMNHASIEEDGHDKIEKILAKRLGRVGDTGRPCYSVSSISISNKMEMQYLVKWLGWSHLHNTWETEETLLKGNVKGMKRLHNYIKKEEEKLVWENSASPEDMEYMKIQQELHNRLLEQFKEIERVIDARRTMEGSGQEYFCKWKGLPYAECTWEDGVLVSDTFQDEIDKYMYRNNSDCIPCRSAKVWRQRPKFVVLKEQPIFLGSGNVSLRLRDYQLDGVNWLVNTWCKNNSVILADEMGLGKTIQTIGFLSCLFHNHSLYGPFLLVVPLSTLPSWQKEFDIWACEINLLVYIGDMTSRRMVEWAHENGNLKFNAVLTTYEILLKDKDFLGDVNWAVLVVDEAHRLKNDDSLLYRTLVTFKTNHRLLITGTPLQNSLKELWSLLHFIAKDKFFKWEEFESQHKAYEEGDTANLASLHKQLEPYLLRRVKKDVEKSLPAKVERILRVEMSSVQKQYYRWILTKNYKALSKGVKGSITGFINVIMELKKCCNHIHIVRSPETPDVKDSLNSLLQGSGKLYLLDKLLVRLRDSGHRVLIFSQMVRMLDILAEYMKLRRFLYQRLDGSITGQQRKEAIDHFNSEGSQDFCFLLSTRAGGLGVNLATADTVIIFDSDWNPQNDLQAQARAHRIGQTKQVNIYRLVTKNSVEEDIVERAKQKMILDHLVIQRMDTTGRTVLSQKREQANNLPFDKEELSAILKFGTNDLFKEGSKEEDKALMEMDIDEILRRAETQETSREGTSVAQELLSQFKVASFSMDENALNNVYEGHKTVTSIKEDPGHHHSTTKDWEDIIPLSYRNQVAEEEKQEEQIQLYLPPRQRTIKNYRESSSEKLSQAKTRGSYRHKHIVADAESVIVSKTINGFNNNEIRKFIASYLKFPLAETRLDAVAADSELQEKSLSDIKQLATLLRNCCQEATDQRKYTTPPILRINGVQISANDVLLKETQLNVLAQYIPNDLQSQKRFRLVIKKPLKHVGWANVKWTSIDDSKLLVGVHRYGIGNWETIKNDVDIGLGKKILPPDLQQKPQAQHLKTRINYLLKALQIDLSFKRELKRNNPRRKGTGLISSSIKGSSSNDDSMDIDWKQTKPRHRKKLAAVKSVESKKCNKRLALRKKKDIQQHFEGSVKNRSCRRMKEESKLTDDDIYIISDYEIDEEIFLKCKSMLKPVKKSLMQLSPRPTPKKDSAQHQTIVEIGDHISSCLSAFTNNDAVSEWRCHLWIFVAKFTAVSGRSLFNLYTSIKEQS